MEDGLSPLNAIDFEHNTVDTEGAELSSRAKKRQRPPKSHALDLSLALGLVVGHPASRASLIAMLSPNVCSPYES